MFPPLYSVLSWHRTHSIESRSKGRAKVFHEVSLGHHFFSRSFPPVRAGGVPIGTCAGLTRGARAGERRGTAGPLRLRPVSKRPGDANRSIALDVQVHLTPARWGAAEVLGAPVPIPEFVR